MTNQEKKDERFWEVYNHYIMAFDGNERAAMSCAWDDLGYWPSN